MSCRASLEAGQGLVSVGRVRATGTIANGDPYVGSLYLYQDAEVCRSSGA